MDPHGSKLNYATPAAYRTHATPRARKPGWTLAQHALAWVLGFLFFALCMAVVGLLDRF